MNNRHRPTNPEYAIHRKKPARFDISFCDPETLTTITSKQQMKFYFHCVRNAYFGRLIILPHIWAEALSSTTDTIRKFTKRFCEDGILRKSKDSRYEYVFTHYKDMVKDQKNYVPLYQFMLEDDFMRLSLPAQRIAMYFLGLLSKRGSKNKVPIVKSIESWHSRDNEEYRMFPFCNRSEAFDAIKECTKIFDIDLSKLETDKQYALLSLNEQFRDKYAYSDGKDEWMKQFLKEHSIVYYHNFHLKHLIQTFDSLESEVGWEMALDVWTSAFLKVNLGNQDTADLFLGRLFMNPDEEEVGEWAAESDTYNYDQSVSKAVKIFTHDFLRESILEYSVNLKEEQVNIEKYDVILSILEQSSLFSKDQRHELQKEAEEVELQIEEKEKKVKNMINRYITKPVQRKYHEFMSFTRKAASRTVTSTTAEIVNTEIKQGFESHKERVFSVLPSKEKWEQLIQQQPFSHMKSTLSSIIAEVEESVCPVLQPVTFNTVNALSAYVND